MCDPVDGARLEQASVFRYLGCILDESGTDAAECRRKVKSGRKLLVLSGPWLMLGVCSLSV